MSHLSKVNLDCQLEKSVTSETPRPPYLEKSRFDWVFLNDGVPKVSRELFRQITTVINV